MIAKAAKHSPKTVLAIWHTANKGKTETLREFAKLLLLRYPRHIVMFPIPLAVIPQTGDFRLVVQINGKVIAIESQGDPKTGLKKRLWDLANNFRADVIICSTRTKGDTVSAVNSLHPQFEIIWSSTYQVDNNQNLVNRLKATHLIDLLRALKII